MKGLTTVYDSKYHWKQ